MSPSRAHKLATTYLGGSCYSSNYYEEEEEDEEEEDEDFGLYVSLARSPRCYSFAFKACFEVEAME